MPTHQEAIPADIPRQSYKRGGGHIQPREQDFVISEEGISMSLPASYNLPCFKIMEIVRYEDIQDISVSERRE